MIVNVKKRQISSGVQTTNSVISLASLLVAIVVMAATWYITRAASAQPSANSDGAELLYAINLIGNALSVILLWSPIQAFRNVIKSSKLMKSGEMVAARQPSWQAKEYARNGLGYSVAFSILVAAYAFITSNDFAVQKAFLNVDYMRKSVDKILAASYMNVKIALAAEAIILVVALVVALMRLAPGRAGEPIRLMAIAYVDMFRAIPTVIVIYLVGFGLPLVDISFISNWDGMWYAVLALSLSYSGYVSELYRSAIEGIHKSQLSAARSLGLSAAQAYRYVIIPQAVRRVIPPLLGFFVSLQKDTALVLVVGLMDAFGQSKYYSANYFNLSPVSVVGIMFLIITIPQTRLVDYLTERQKKSTGN